MSIYDTQYQPTNEHQHSLPEGKSSGISLCSEINNDRNHLQGDGEGDQLLHQGRGRSDEVVAHQQLSRSFSDETGLPGEVHRHQNGAEREGARSGRCDGSVNSDSLRNAILDIHASSFPGASPAAIFDPADILYDPFFAIPSDANAQLPESSLESELALARSIIKEQDRQREQLQAQLASMATTLALYKRIEGSARDAEEALLRLRALKGASSYIHRQLNHGAPTRARQMPFYALWVNGEDGYEIVGSSSHSWDDAFADMAKREAK